MQIQTGRSDLYFEGKRGEKFLGKEPNKKEKVGGLNGADCFPRDIYHSIIIV